VRQGAGSAFFLHVTDGAPTAGCVAIPASRLVPLMRWLTPGTHPRILIGLA
jgi:L,D-peptidoglycan transpeptidase YkuD (ErfK/YbiS/YcfS/YnhG family)